MSEPMGSGARPVSLTRGLAILASLFTALILAGAPALAQGVDRASDIYRLSEGSKFQRGCFPPCLCPVMMSGPDRGTFVLTPTGSDGLFDYYRVTEVNFTVSLSDSELRVIGSGTYKVGGEFARQHQLSLDLKVGDEAVQHFDSGLVAGGDFPKIDITVSIHGQTCFDTVLEIHASPVPVSEVHPYVLLSGSTFQRGCSGPCACAPGPSQRIFGSFSLVDLRRTPLFDEFAVAHVNWRVGPEAQASSIPGTPVVGFGNYRVGGEVAIQQQMGLDLRVGAEETARYDSGLVSGGAIFPRIDIAVSNSTSCVVTVINLRAKPVRTAASISVEPIPPQE